MYKLEARIGAGGMGEVHRAHHLLLRRSTAVKLLLPDRIDAESLARFEREVQATSLLTHPNTIAIYDYGHTAEGMFYYAMEYLDGGIDLEKLVARYGKQPPARVVRILVQICGALQEAHDQNLIHRDIKPANIMLCERGGMPDIAKVLDFGLVKEIRGDAAASTQIVLGTPGYVAPETTTGVVGPAGDLYCLGCVTYFLLTGKRVFDAKSNIDLFLQHVTARPVAPSQHAPGLPPELDAVVLRCLEKEPDARFANATALADALRAVPLAEPWSDAQARAWWAARRKAEADAVATSALETRTITVNLDVRESAA
jgi:serine/threonine-protein kinase